MKTFMTVDPGLGGTGWAAWSHEHDKPILTGVVHARNPKDDWLLRAKDISARFSGLLMEQRYGSAKFYLETVHIEYPGLFTSAAGYASAQRGDVFKLMFLVGCLAREAWNCPLEVKDLPVNDWKGQLSKEAVAARVARALDCEKDAYPNHTMDAVGMGLFLKGKLDSTGATRSKG